MTPVQLDCAYSMQLDGMVKARAEKENLRHLALMAREAMNRRGAELSLPADGARLWIWSDLHFHDERILLGREAPVPEHLRDERHSGITGGRSSRQATRLCVPGTSAVGATFSVAGSRPATISPAERSSFSATTTSTRSTRRGRSKCTGPRSRWPRPASRRCC